jgi:predicted dehydrogenase
MNGRRTRVAVVGLGRRGRQHLDIVKALDDRLEVVGVCEHDRTRLAEGAVAAGDVPAERSLKRLLANVRPDYVALSVKPDQEPPAVRQLSAAGVSVLCEVPPALAGPPIDQMIEAAQRAGTVVAAAENYIRLPREQLKRALIAAGVFGEISGATVKGLLGHKGHEIAMARAYVGAQNLPTRVRARGEGRFPPMEEGLRIPARVEGEIEFESGAVVQIALSRRGDHPDGVPAVGLQYDFTGTLGSCRDGRFFVGKGEEEREIPWEARTLPMGGVEVLQELVAASDPPVTWRNPFADKPFVKDHRIRYYEHLDDGPQAWEIALAEDHQRMIRAIGGEPDAVYPLAQSRRDVRLRLALIESTRRGGAWVEWQEKPFPIEKEVMRFNWRRFLKRLRPAPRVPKAQREPEEA